MLYFLALAAVMVFRPELFNESLKEKVVFRPELFNKSLKEKVQSFEGRIEIDP